MLGKLNSHETHENTRNEKKNKNLLDKISVNHFVLLIANFKFNGHETTRNEKKNVGEIK